MVNAGASIEAYLKLNATDFTDGLKTAESSVVKFKESMLDVGKQGDVLSSGMGQVSNAINHMIQNMELLNTVDDKAIKKMKEVGLAMEHIATGAQRLGSDARRGGEGMEMLNTTMGIFEAGMSSAEVTINATVGQLKALRQETNNAKSSAIQLSESEKLIQSQFQLLDNTLSHNIYKTDEVRALTQRLRSEYGLTGQKLVEVRSQLMQTVQATTQYAQALNQPSVSLKKWINDNHLLGTSLNTVATTLQRWKSLTDSIVNSTAQNISTSLSKVRTSASNLTTSLTNESTAIQKVSTNLNKLTGQTSQATSNKRILNNEIVHSIQATTQYARALQLPSQYMREGGAEAQRYRLLQQGVNLTLEDNINHLRRLSAEMQKNAQEKLKNMGFTKQMNVAEKELASTTNQTSSAMQRQAVSSQKAATATQRQTTATRGLSRALSSLRMMGTMVGSMLAYNFVHHLGQATNETIQSKSEMEGYFKMLHYGQGEIDKFNNALDKTVQRFQRVNKYSLGETISSIGVEFDLTTDEMIKAMDVTSMVTSEYLRAGRNANEASLAVKDVLQGQFQRLSRETGVKGEQLKDAGWSGDVNNVNSLLDALRKVGEDRNWDVFATKANSLNDVVTILQNRFGEWSADMVNVVQPTIVGVFNSIMSFGEGLSQSLSGMWKWLNGDSFGALATKIGLVSGAILTLMPMLTAWRSGSSLLQVANMGLLQSIGSLVFGLNAEALATTTTSEAIATKLLGITAEQLEETTLVGVINGMIVARAGEATATEVATGANLGFVGGLSAVITGEAIAEGTTISLTGALGLLTGAFLASPIGWFTLAVLGLASAFYVLSGGLSDTWGKMKQFHETMDDPHSAINPYRERVESLNQKLEEAKEKYGEGSKEVENYEQKLKSAKETLDAVNQSVQHGVYWTDQYNKEYEELGATMDSSLRKVMQNHGYSKEQIDQTGQLLDSMEIGTDKTYRALQVLHKQQSDSEKSLNSYADSLDRAGIKGEEASDKMSNLAGNLQNLQMHSAIANTTDDWWDYIFNSLYAGLDQFWIDWDKTIAQIQGDILNWDFVSDEGKQNLGNISEWLGNVWKGITDGLSNWQIDAREFLKPLDDLGAEFNNFISDPLGYLGIGNIDIIGAVFNAFASSGDSTGGGYNGMKKIDTTWLVSYVNSTIIVPLTNFVNDPIGTISSWGLTLPSLDIGTFIQGILNFSGGGGVDFGGVLSKVFNIDGIISYFNINLPTITTSVANTVTSVTTLFTNLKNAIWSRISSIVTNVTTGFTNLKNNAVSKITAMKDSVQGVIDKMVNAWNTMKNAILNSANAIMNGVKEKFDNVKTTIGGFYHKLTNPSEWFSGSGVREYSSSPKPQTARRLFAPVTRTAIHHGAGIDPYKGDKKQITLDELVRQLGGNKKVDLNGFLSLFENSGFGSWDFAKQHKDIIFGEGKKWRANSPSMNGIVLGDGFPVKRFWDGKASGFSWGEFMSVATAIFSTIPYRFYMDSDWKGNWVSALLSGAVNCSDGADALIALARLFGFNDVSKVHTNLKDGTGHFYARINGHNLDTTHFQKSGSWSPLGGAGIPTRSASYNSGSGQTQGKTVNVHIDMSNSTIYGVDDLDDRIEESTKKAIREEFNDPYTVPI